MTYDTTCKAEYIDLTKTRDHVADHRLLSVNPPAAYIIFYASMTNRSMYVLCVAIFEGTWYLRPLWVQLGD